VTGQDAVGTLKGPWMAQRGRVAKRWNAILRGGPTCHPGTRDGCIPAQGRRRVPGGALAVVAFQIRLGLVTPIPVRHRLPTIVTNDRHAEKDRPGRRPR
jgi:hypothetical protein